MPAASETFEYVCTLQFAPGSPWLKELELRRAACFRELGPDETGLYPPHVSVTGFFSANAQEASELCIVLEALLARYVCSNPPPAELRNILSTPDGHVLIDVAVPGLALLAADFACQAKSLGVAVRPKAVRHLSLASRRTASDQSKIMELHGNLWIGTTQLDLVLSKLIRRSSVENLEKHGQVHNFEELLRLPLAAGSPPQRPKNRPLFSAFCAYASTPLRKRPLDAIPQAVREITPPKCMKLTVIEPNEVSK